MYQLIIFCHFIIWGSTIMTKTFLFTHLLWIPVNSGEVAVCSVATNTSEFSLDNSSIARFEHWRSWLPLFREFRYCSGCTLQPPISIAAHPLWDAWLSVNRNTRLTQHLLTVRERWYGFSLQSLGVVWVWRRMQVLPPYPIRVSRLSRDWTPYPRTFTAAVGALRLGQCPR
jgi:hypothetical protein